MRILVVTNLYPPYYHGGYEIRCAQVAEALRAAGHEVCVLTSAYGLPVSRLGNPKARTEERNGIRVHRWLSQHAYPPQPSLRPWTIFQARRELADVRGFVKVVAEFRPDIVNWWSMYGLSKSLLPLPPAWGIPDVHWVEHWWMIAEYGPSGEQSAVFWAALWDGQWGPRVARPLLRLIGRRWERRVARQGIPTRAFPNRPAHVCFVSEHMRVLHREAGLEFRSSEVIYGGVPPAAFYEPLVADRRHGERLRILYAGQISPDRGLHTVIEALGHVDAALRSQLVLSVAGTGPESYLSCVREQIEKQRLTDCVTFLGKVPHDGMPDIYKQNDVFVFPSLRDEGLPLTMVEAMLAGCAVVTTGSGGAMEVATAARLPLFAKGDAVALSRLLASLVEHPEEVLRIASRGQRVAREEFSFELMMERWSATLERVSGGARRDGGSQFGETAGQPPRLARFGAQEG